MRFSNRWRTIRGSVNVVGRTRLTVRGGAHKARLLNAALVVALALTVLGCGGSPSDSSDGATDGAATMSRVFGGGSEGTTDGPAYTPPQDVMLSPAAITASDATDWGTIDTSTTTDGYVTVAVTNTERIKFQVICGDMSYNYDVPGDGTPVTCPLNMGNGFYTFRVMQNTSGDNYVELNSSDADVTLANEFTPFLRPSTIVRYDDGSACVAKARELVAPAANQGDALQAVCNFVIGHVSYDNDKASKVANVTGYLPNPDETLATGKGICFDYAALGAAMLRSQGIPAKVMTGYVSPEDVYHAWMSVYIDGSWHNVQFSVDPKTWTRVDLTFAAGASAGLVGDGKEYTDRYTY